MMHDAVVTTVLADGTEVDFRPVGPDDKPLLQQGMAMMSPTSRRLRFMSAIENLSRSQLAYLTEIDHESHLAWGAMIAGQPVGVGRVVRLTGSPTTAEIAIAVVDDWHCRGIGKMLVRLLAEIARSVGIEQFVYEALPENEGIVALFDRFGASHTLTEGIISGVLEVDSVEPIPLLAGDLLGLGSAAREFRASEAFGINRPDPE